VNETNEIDKFHPYAMALEGVLKALGTDPRTGLSSQEARERFEKFGPNEIQGERPKTLFEMFVEQFKDFLVLILIASTVIAIFLGEMLDAIVIMAIVVLNATMGVVQERRAERALSALKKMASPTPLLYETGQLRGSPPLPSFQGISSSSRPVILSRRI